MFNPSLRLQFHLLPLPLILQFLVEMMGTPHTAAAIGYRYLATSLLHKSLLLHHPLKPPPHSLL
ncbi:hypothetical protein GBAR_LOCUS5161, partial [Geodia barretti]